MFVTFVSCLCNLDDLCDIGRQLGEERYFHGFTHPSADLSHRHRRLQHVYRYTPYCLANISSRLTFHIVLIDLLTITLEHFVCLFILLYFFCSCVYNPASGCHINKTIIIQKEFLLWTTTQLQQNGQCSSSEIVHFARLRYQHIATYRHNIILSII